MVMMLRAYSRLYCSRRLGIEDALGLVGYITFLGAFISVVLLSQSPGLWVHLWNIRVRDLESFIKKQLVFDTCYSLTMIFVKAAVLVEWARMFVPAGRDLFFWTCYTTLSTNGLLYVAAIIAGWLTCTPQRKLWRPWEAGHCIGRKKLDGTVVVLNLVFDLVILFLPQRVIWKLHTTQRHKLGIAFLLSVGVLACVSAAGRVYATFTLSYDSETGYHQSAVSQLWGLAEGTCVLMVFCLSSGPKIFNRKSHLVTESSARSDQKPGDSVYRRMEDLPLADRAAIKVRPNGEFNGIIKTKEFSTHETPNTSDSALFRDQHPWMQDASRSAPSTRTR
ncbi:hypothetical protein PGQ11_012942 [Apiospora arundinis]|uniref:Rhodopsin domain-containing protein n=1 Tax=Apiospora arundinis TaxID=335852 RepID=A0ABR2I647_9PEZI